jgi:hypothetical protein
MGIRGIPLRIVESARTIHFQMIVEFPPLDASDLSESASIVPAYVWR